FFGSTSTVSSRKPTMLLTSASSTGRATVRPPVATLMFPPWWVRPFISRARWNVHPDRGELSPTPVGASLLAEVLEDEAVQLLLGRCGVADDRPAAGRPVLHLDLPGHVGPGHEVVEHLLRREVLAAVVVGHGVECD